MTVMVRTKSVMVRTTSNKIGTKTICFRNSDHNEPVKDRGPMRRVDLALSDWLELGSPDEITVTIEPGDTLND